MGNVGLPSAPALPIEDILRCAGDSTFLASVAELYDELAAEIAAHHPICTNRGACCRFGEFGHRLFVTPVELAYFMGTSEGSIRRPETDQECPYQRGGLCTAREGRPTGCRIFFCEPRSGPWQPPMTERTLRRLKNLHDRFDLPYLYLDWMRALEGLAAVDGGGPKT